MNYQISNQGAFDSTVFNNKTKGTGDGGSGMFGNSAVGDIIACELVRGGKEPILSMNGVEIKTRAAHELDMANPGDTIYLKIQSADKEQVNLKIIGTKAQMEAAGENAGAFTSTAVMQNTEQLSEMIKDNIGNAVDEEEASENQKEILRSLSSAEIAELRMMQIDITNAKLSDLMGMVISIRSEEHIDERNEQIADIVAESLGELRRDLIPMNEGTKSNADVTYVSGPARLNSEGYIVVNNLKSNTVVGSVDDIKSFKVDENKKQTPPISDEQIIYMVKNGMGLTVEGYKTAKNSVNEESPAKAIEIDDKVWNDIYPQVSNIIESTGLSVSAQTITGVRFLLSHELPITPDSIRTYMSAKALNEKGFNEDQTRANMEEQLKASLDIEKARINGTTMGERAGRLLEKVNAITDKAVDAAATTGKPLTIAYLYNNSMKNAEVKTMRSPVRSNVEGASLSLSADARKSMEAETETTLSSDARAVAARRQVEEIRLAMTNEAAIRLVRKDFNIDTRPLSKVIESLKEEEEMHYQEYIAAADMHDIPDGVDLFKETLKQTDALKLMPEYILGETVRRPSITVGGLYDAGIRTRAALAGQAYETMMTRPRQDMGDSINEAFRNVDDILSDMNQDRNDENRRAVRILAYNQMEITETNILSVKNADAKLNQMFETLTPQVVLNLIRENKNPLNMTIDGLNQEISQQREILGITDEQRFSEFLYQMDRNNTISDEERKSFIGIYRLLDKIEKSHGKDIGALVRNGQEITLKNLFSADKSRKAAGINVGVDDAFGGERVNVSTPENSILGQIKTAYNQSLTESIVRHIRPEALQMTDMDTLMDMSLEEFNNVVKAADNGTGQGELEDFLKESLNEALDHVDEVETMLEAQDMPTTVTNIVAAYQVMYGQDGIYGMIRDLKKTVPLAARNEITEMEGRILTEMETKDDVVYGLENVRSSLADAVHAKEEDGTITAMDIQSLKLLNAGMPIAMRAAYEDSFRIPIVVDDRVSIMKVSILRDGETAGEINVTVPTQKYGELTAYIRAEGNSVEGYILTEEETGQSELEANELTLRSAFAKAGMEVRDLRLDGTIPRDYGIGMPTDAVETSKLYRVAKQLLTAIKLSGIIA